MQKQRIAVLGGGMASISAVFEMTDAPDWQDHFEIDVYQLGWRLGGKGASGRNCSGPAGVRDRIEEHGLHIWFGFYENAFNQIQRCYKKLGRPPGHPMRTWREAFTPQDFVVTEEFADGAWQPWEVQFPTNASLPGQGDPFPSIADYIRMLGQWLAEAWRRLRDDDSPIHETPATELSVRAIEAICRDFGAALPTTLTVALRRAVDRLLGILHAFAKTTGMRTRTRRAYIVADIVGAALRGLLVDRVVTRGFDRLDELDFREWLRRHGASEYSLHSAFMRGTYDTVFGYLDGDPEKEVLAAGTGLRSGLRMLLGYKGHFMWKMNAGMGDIVFTPYYEVLARRGVRFHFFHRVDALRLSGDRRSVASVQMRKQATLKSGAYDPLVPVNGLPCWPSEPRYEQLVEGDELRQRAVAGENVNLESYWSSWDGVSDITLKAGQDYDTVLLGIPIAALPHIAGDLIAANPSWRDMVTHIRTNRTMNAQLWLHEDVSELGWIVQRPPVIGGFVRPLSVWADLTHLIPEEGWSGVPRPPRHLAYLVGPMRDTPEPPYFSDPSYPASQAAIVRAETLDYLTRHVRPLWPNAFDAQGRFRWDLLVDAEGRSYEDRIDAQYLRANIDPNERYTLSVKGSTKYRLKPEQSGFTNLILTGDWTYSGLNAGCIEAAVMSGMQASRAIAGYPTKIVAENDGLNV